MTLSRQLAALIIALLLLVFAGTFLISVHNTRDYLEKQLESHAQDAATSLGLSISSHMTGDDLAIVTSMTDAIFDRGFYRLIRVEDMEGKPMVDRVLPVKIEGIPEWFIEGLPLTTPEGKSIVMDGWVQAGQVLVRSHPGYAYNQLWTTVTETFWWFLVSAGVVLLIGILLLKLVLKPLKAVEWQADAICNRDFPILDKLPRTQDLRRIVEAMNRMSAKVRQMLDELEVLASGLRRQAHQHPVTGLANKKYFMDHLVNQVNSTESFSKGALYLIQLKDFKHYNDTMGYQAGDELLGDAAKLLEQLAERQSKSLLAHLSGADFALLAEDCSIDGARELARELAAVLAGLYGTGKLDEPDVGHVGGGYFDGGQTVSQLMSEADMALRMAQSKGANEWHLSVPDDMSMNQVRGASEWRDFITRALEMNLIKLMFQPVVSCPEGRPLHSEVLVRLPENLDAVEQGLLSAGVFMPQAESFGMTIDIDKAVIEQVLGLLNERRDEETSYAINISPPSVLSASFVAWLDQRLAANAAVANRLIFEMPEYGAVALIDKVNELIEVVGRYGSLFSLDHFGRSFSSLAYLRSFKADYLKIDGSFIRSLNENRDNAFFVQALTEIAHGLEIKVIAESVESEEVWKLLSKLHLDGAQGYYIGKPE
jgi:diguanylate cyclase (GGDEF)-like protein